MEPDGANLKITIQYVLHRRIRYYRTAGNLSSKCNSHQRWPI